MQAFPARRQASASTVLQQEGVPAALVGPFVGCRTPAQVPLALSCSRLALMRGALCGPYPGVDISGMTTAFRSSRPCRSRFAGKSAGP